MIYCSAIAILAMQITTTTEDEYSYNPKKACCEINSSDMSQYQEKGQLIDTLKAPIIEMGRSLGYEVIENYNLGAGPIHIAWIFKPGNSNALPDIRIGFVCLTETSQFSINEAVARALLSLMDKLVLVVPSESMTKTVSDSLESIPERPSILQLRKYVTVLTPSTLTSKVAVKGSRSKRTE